MSKKDQLDFGGDMNFEELDFDFDENPKPSTVKNKGKPIDHVVDGVKESMRSKFTDPSHLKSMFRKALPEGFGRAWDAADTVGTDAGRLYDESIKEIAPTAGAIARKLDQLMPSGAGRAKRFTQNLAQRFEQTKSYDYQNSRQEQEDSGVARMLAELDQSRQMDDAERQKREETLNAVNDRVEGKRFKANQGVLGVIADSSLALRKYAETFDMRYKRKSLELQFRSYSAQAALLNNFTRYTESANKFHQALLVNTALPEYAKTSDTQRYKDRLKGQTFDKINNSLFGQKSRLGLAGDRVIKGLREKKDGMKDAMEMLDDALGMAIDSKEMGQDMAEMTGKTYSGWNTVGAFGGSILGDTISDWLSERVKGLAEKNPKLLKKSMDVGQMAVNPGSIIEKLRNSKRYKDMGQSESGELLKSGLDLVMSLLGGEKADLTVKNASIGSEYEDKIHTQVRQARTINEIIPGYLARILREITVLRTGDTKEGLLTFDVNSGRFKTEKAMSSDLLAGFQKHAKEYRADKGTYSEEFEDLYKKFTGNETVDEATSPEIRKFLQKLSRSSDDFSYSDSSLKNTKEYKEMSEDGKRVADSILSKRFSGDTLESSTNRFRMASSASKVKASIGNLKGPIDKAIKDGYAELLEQSGVIRRNAKGDWDIDEDKYYEFFDSGTIKSDINLKTNISPIDKNPNEALKAFRNTNLFNWDYKKNANSKGGEHLGYAGYTGPMAQDVRANFGNDTAPGGVKIDLVNMNGHTMAAVKALTEKVDQMGSSESLGYLKSIDSNVKLLVEKGLIGNRGEGESTGGGFSGPMGFAGHAGGLLTELLKAGGSAVSSAAGRASQAGGFMARLSKSFWTDNKDSIKSARDSALKIAIDSAQAATTFGIDVLYNKLPAGVKAAKRFGMQMVDKAKELFHNARDLYIPGRDSPAIQGVLLKAGYYRDKATGAVLRTMDDIAKATGDIVDGNNQVVVSALEKATGLYDSAGTKLKSFLGRGLELAGKGLAYANNAARGLIQGARDFIGSGKIGKAGATIASGIKSAGSAFSGIALPGIGGDKRVVPVLIQIRDLLALGKHGKRVAEILGRSLTEPKRTTAARDKPDAPAGVDDSPEVVGNALTAQVRDLLASIAPADAVKEVMTRAKNASNFLKIPLIGEKVKKFMDKFTGNKSGTGMTGSDSQAGNTTTGDASSQGGQDPQVTQGQQNPNGEKPPSLFERMQGLFGAGRNAAGSFAGAARKQFPNMGKGKRSQQAKGLFNRFKGSKAGQFLGKGLGTAGSILGGVGTIAAGIFGGGGPNQPGAIDPSAQAGNDPYSAANHAQRLAELKGNDGSKSFKKGTDFADNDGDGQRDGGAADRMRDANAAKVANEERKQANIDKSLQAATAKANINRPADDAIEKMIAAATGGLTAIAGMAGNILSGAAGILGLLGMGGGGKGGILRKGAGVAGKVLGVAGAGIGMLGKGLGKGIMGTMGILSKTGGALKGAASLAPGTATVGRVAVTGMRVAQVVGLAFGGAGGLIAGTLGILGAALTSPVVIGAAAVGAVGYGAYKLTKYLTRNNIDEWERIRAMQYGLDGTDATKAFNSKVFGLENYLLDGKLAYTNGRPKVNDRTVKPEELLEMFDINVEDKEMQDKFAMWYRDRFQPVFLHHVALLHRINRKLKLSEIKDLEPAQKLEYLSSADIDGVWDYTTSPFKGLDVLNNNPKPCRELIAAMIQTQGLKVQKTAKKDIKAGADKPKGEDAANATKVIKSAVPAATSDTAATPALSAADSAKARNPSSTNFKGSVGSNTGMARMDKAGGASGVIANSVPGGALGIGTSQVEEGKEPTNGQSDRGTLSFKGGGAGSSGLKIAEGSVSAGDQGAQFLKMGKDATIEGLHPRMKQHLLGMAQEYGEQTGKSILINEGFRSYQRQAELFRKYGPGRAAPPGSSLHEYGLALDINTGIMTELEQMGLLRKYGFTRPIRGETWHTEPAGIQGGIQRAKQDGSYADAAIMASLGRGGGGLGSTPNAQKGGRDAALAKSIFESGSASTVVAKNKDDTGGLGAGLNGLGPKAGAITNSAGATMAESVSDSPKPAGTSFAKLGAGDGIKSTGAAAASAAASIGDGTGKFDKVKADVAKYSAEAGGNPNEMMLLAAMESSLNPTKGNTGSSAKGLMQYVDDTWNEQANKYSAKYNIDPTKVMDPRSQVILASKGFEQKEKALRTAAGGRPLTFTDKYLGHMLGQGGASVFLRSDPSEIASKVMPDAAKRNPQVFTDNGRPRTIGEVRAYIDNRVKTTAKDFGIQLPNDLQGSPTTSSASNGVSVTSPATSGVAPQSPSSLESIRVTADNMRKGNEKPAMMKGYQLPGGTLPSFTKAVDTSVKTNSRISESPASGQIPGISMSGNDRSTSLTDEVFVRLTAATDTQVKHLASIDKTLLDTMVPLLTEIAANTADASKNARDTTEKPAPSKSSPLPNRNGQAIVDSSRNVRASKSALDNRRPAYQA